MNNPQSGIDSGQSSNQPVDWPPAAGGEMQEPNVPNPWAAWSAFINFPITKIVLFFVMSVLFSIPLGIPLAFAYFIGRLSMSLFIFYGEIDALLGAIPALLIMAWLVDRKPIAAFGFRGRSASLKETTIGFLIGAGLMSLVFAAFVAGGWVRLSPAILSAVDQRTISRDVFFFFIVALYEETVFRGYFFQTLENRWGSGIALLSSMVVFGVLHIFNLGPNPKPAALIGGLFIGAEAGLLLAAAYMLLRRLWLPIGIHWAWNLFQGSVYGAPVSGLPIGPSVYHAQFHGPTWITGGEFGPEAGLPALIIGTLVGLIFLRMAVRNGNWISFGDLQGAKTATA